MELESTGILRLIIREVEPSDYGTYSVTLSNIHGSATCSAKICPDSKDNIFEILTPKTVLIAVLSIIVVLYSLIAFMMPPEFYCSSDTLLGDVQDFLYKCTVNCKCQEKWKILFISLWEQALIKSSCVFCFLLAEACLTS